MKEEIKERLEQIRRGELPDGYKRTKAGIMPGEWKSETLQTLCDINPKRNGDTPDKVTFIGMSDTDESGRIIRQRIVPYNAVCRGYTPFLRGDVLVAKITPCFENGKGAYTENLETECGFGSTEFHVLRCRPVISGAYLSFHTQSEKFRKELQTEMTGTAGQKRVQTASIASYCVALPPLAEQRRIAEILSAQDGVIAFKERLVSEKLRQKQYLMQRLLTGKQRLPGFNGEWTTRSLRQVGTLCSGTGFPEIYQGKKDGEIPFYKVSDMNTNPYNRYLKEANHYIDGETAKILHAKEIPAHSIVFAKVGAAILLERKRILSVPSCIDNNMMAFTPFTSDYVLYIYYWFLNTKLSALINEGALPSINAANIGKLRIDIPPIEEQRAIADVLSAADREIELLRASLEQEQRKKKALSQLLLTGIVRV